MRLKEIISDLERVQSIINRSKGTKSKISDFEWEISDFDELILDFIKADYQLHKVSHYHYYVSDGGTYIELKCEKRTLTIKEMNTPPAHHSDEFKKWRYSSI